MAPSAPLLTRPRLPLCSARTGSPMARRGDEAEVASPTPRGGSRRGQDGRGRRGDERCAGRARRARRAVPARARHGWPGRAVPSSQAQPGPPSVPCQPGPPRGVPGPRLDRAEPAGPRAGTEWPGRTPTYSLVSTRTRTYHVHNMVKETTEVHGGHELVTVTLATTVAPALPLQEHRLPLSNLDLLLPPLEVSVFFCYLHPAPTAAALKEALAKMLVAYYPLAGEVVANGDGEPELLCSGRGVDFTEASAGGAELRELRLGMVDEVVEKLVPVKLAGVISVQVTKFKCGGTVVGCTFDHRVCDAYSFNMFLVAWAAAARGGSPPTAPSFSRSLVAPRNPPPRAPSTDALIDRLFSPLSSAPPPPTVAAVAINRIYRIAAADIAALQASAGPGRTKLEAFTAHLWQLCSRAATPRQRSCCMGLVVDGRSRLFPNGAMKAYFGNVLTIPYGVVGTDDLRCMTLADVADDVHRWVLEAATGEHFRGLVDWVEALRPKPAAARAYLGGTGGTEAAACIVSSGMGFPVGEADFGTGLPAFASYHFPWPAGAGYVMPMPSARGDGDWVVYVHAAPEMVKLMAEEPTIFRALENSHVFG